MRWLFIYQGKKIVISQSKAGYTIWKLQSLLSGCCYCLDSNSKIKLIHLMKTDSQRLSQNMICAGLGRLTTALWHWLQVAMAAWGKASAADPDLHPELCLTPSWLLKAAAASSPAPAGSQDAGTRSGHDCGLLFSGAAPSWALLLLHSFFPDLPWGIAHRGTPYTSAGLQAGPAAEPPSKTADKTTRKVERPEKRTPYPIPAEN